MYKSFILTVCLYNFLQFEHKDEKCENKEVKVARRGGKRGIGGLLVY